MISPPASPHPPDRTHPDGTLLDGTHDPSLRSRVPSANHPDTPFPIQNLPFGVFRPRGPGSGAPITPRVGVAIGSEVLDLAEAVERGLLSGPAAEACRAPNLNPLLALDRTAWRELRRQLSALLRAPGPDDPYPSGEGAALPLHPMDSVELLLPFAVGDFTDFYASIHHARNVGSMFRPQDPLLPNYRWIPIGYHGRASSVVVSGTAIGRPKGQRRSPDQPTPEFGPSRQLDYELEVGIVVGGGENPLGTPIPMQEAEDRIFGICLLNDWSARDLQAWEYQPLGPFLSKSFASTLSPWIVTLEALAPFRVPAATRAPGDPSPLPHLDSDRNRRSGGIGITMEVFLSSRDMRAGGVPPVRVSRSGFGNLYWTPAQLLAHHASNGCNLRPGDLLGSGTVSGPTPEERGCLLERSWRGTEPLALPDGSRRSFLEDGDEVILTAHCSREGWRAIGFGSCAGIIEGAPDAAAQP